MRTLLSKVLFFVLVITVISAGRLDATEFIACDPDPTIRVADLIAAIHAANASKEADTIDLDRGCTYDLMAVDNASCRNAPTGLPVITTEIVINGHGATIQRASGTPNFRIFCIENNGNLTLNNVTVSGGSIPAGSGGGISMVSTLTDTAALTLNGSKVCGNLAGSGAGIFNGHGTASTITNGTVTLIDSDICHNNATATNGAGGGIYNRIAGKVFLYNSTVNDNETAGCGGGGLWNEGQGFVSVTNSTFSRNKALSTGVCAPGRGGAIASNRGSVILHNSTISGNSAVDGGGLYNSGFDSGEMNLTHCSVIGNFAATADAIHNVDGPNSTVTLKNTIVGDSSLFVATAGADTVGEFIVGGNNIVQTPIAGSPLSVLTITANPLLNPLGSNGGTTETHDFMRGNTPARNAADSKYCPPTDQRGDARPTSGIQCDIGSYEK